MEKTLKHLISLIPLLLPTYLLRFSVFGVPTTFLEIYLYFVFLFFLIYLFQTRSRLDFKPFKLPLILTLIALISSVLAREKVPALGQFKAYFFDGLIALVLFNQFKSDNEWKSRVLFSYLSSAIIVSLWGIFQRFDLIGLIDHQTSNPLILTQLEQGRVFGPFESPNYLAMYITPVLIILSLSLAKLDNQGPFRSIPLSLKMIILFILILALFFSQSISSLIALFLILFFFLFYRYPAKRYYLVGLALLLIIFGLFAFKSLPLNKAGSYYSRLEIYKATYEIGKDHQLIGLGMGNYLYFYGEYIKNVPNRINWEALHPHNIFFAYWIYFGWFGLITFLAILYKGLNKENFVKKTIYFFAFLTIILNGLTDTTFFKNDLSIIFWMLYAFLI